MLFGGSVGFGEAYVAGHWTSNDVTAVARLFLRNRDVLGSLESGAARLSRALNALTHALRRNTERGGRRNVRSHYDLGNDFFELVLDPTMSYSCALFGPDRETLEQASIAKIESVLEPLALESRSQLLEIGSGWGALANHAARTRGCAVTTTTISRAQREYLANRSQPGVRVIGLDWRRLSGRYDAIASVEMIEAVGHQNYDAFFFKCRELLRPGGRMVLQAIVISDDRFDWAKHRVDFVKKHVFPGSCLPSVRALSCAAARAELRILETRDITEHYPPTLRAWRENLHDGADAIRALGYPSSLVRTWDYYLSYCEAGFLERHIRDVQIVLERAA